MKLILEVLICIILPLFIVKLTYSVEAAKNITTKARFNMTGFGNGTASGNGTAGNGTGSQEDDDRFIENLYEPYWPKGDWVYFKTTIKRRTRRTTRLTTGVNDTTTTTITTASASDTTTAVTPAINYLCQHPCPGLFREYGTVCGQRYNKIKYEVKEFGDACDLMEANCPTVGEKHRGQWRLLHKGPCSELKTEFPWPPTVVADVVSRQQYYVSEVLANRWKYNTKYTTEKVYVPGAGLPSPPSPG